MSKKRIAFNAAATYLQSLFSVALGMFSIRWIYLALGKENFGLFSAVGAILGFIGLFNTVLSRSDSRFFALAIGEGRKHGPEHAVRELNAWFNTSFSVHLVLAVSLCFVMAFVGEHLIRGGVLVIPEGMMDSSLVVFRISLLLMFLSILHMPFIALYTAKQLIFVRNFTHMLQTVLVAGEAWWLLHYEGNRFVAHGILFSATILVSYAILVGLACWSFPECKLKLAYWFDRKRLSDLFSYSTYAFLDALGGCLHGSGFNLVVNSNFGPTANAVIGVGSKVSSKLGSLSGAVMAAVAPEITSRFGASDLGRARKLGTLSCFISAFPVCLIGIPCLFWIHDVLRVFLDNPPDGSDVVIAFHVVTSVFFHASIGLYALVLASQNVRGLQLSSAFLKASSMLLLWMLLKAGVPFLAAVGIAWILPAAAISVTRVWFAKRIVGVSLGNYARTAVFPMSACIVFALLFCTGFRASTGPSFWWLFPCMAANAACLGFLVARLHPDEIVRSAPRKILTMVRHRLHAVGGRHRSPRTRS